MILISLQHLGQTFVAGATSAASLSAAAFSLLMPLINKNIIAEFIVQTIFNETQEKMTYTLVSDKASDPDISDLMTTISESMHIKTPRLTVPFGLLKFVMTFGGSQLTGIPKSSLNFLTNRTFDNQLTKNDFEPELVSKLSASNVPLAIADIDFRLTYGEAGITPSARCKTYLVILVGSYSLAEAIISLV